MPGFFLHYQLSFNPRSREGSDTVLGFETREECVVSIHAPVKGATLGMATAIVKLFSFNPRSREGSDWLRYKARSGSF